MKWLDFIDYHTPGLIGDEFRHGIILNMFSYASDCSRWSFKAPGQCAIKDRSSIILGDLQQEQCRELAEITIKDLYPGVLGSEHTAHWFANRASELGVYFREVEAQQIYALLDPPIYPSVSGEARPVIHEDRQLIADWLTDFYKESARFEIVPNHCELGDFADTNQYMFWLDKGIPVSMAGIARVLNKTAAITGVYTPKEHRGHGYAGAITATVADLIRKMGLVPTLYTDLQVPASNRCYSRIGFRPILPSYHFHR